MSRERAAALLGEAASPGRADRDGGAARQDPARSARPPPAPACPTGSLRARPQILELVAEGLSNREIGARLSISEHTAANHIRSILRKTESANRTEAASYAHRARARLGESSGARIAP